MGSKYVDGGLNLMREIQMDQNPSGLENIEIL